MNCAHPVVVSDQLVLLVWCHPQVVLEMVELREVDTARAMLRQTQVRRAKHISSSCRQCRLWCRSQYAMHALVANAVSNAGLTWQSVLHRKVAETS